MLICMHVQMYNVCACEHAGLGMRECICMCVNICMYSIYVCIYLVSVCIVRMIVCMSLYSLPGLTVEKRIMDLFRAECEFEQTDVANVAYFEFELGTAWPRWSGVVLF